MKRLKVAMTSFTSALSTIGLALLPVFKACPPCPLCMPKYAAILSFLGLPLADYNAYLVPLMWLSMATTVISLAWQGPHNYGDRWPSWIALIACTLIAIGRWFDLQPISYTGMATLLGAMMWHQYRIRSKKHTQSCCAHHHHHP